MSLTVTNPSYDRVFPMYAWRDNNIRLVLTQGEGATTLDGEAVRIKAPRFQLRDDQGIIDLSNSPVVSFALTRPDKSEDLLACTIINAANGIISCPITASATAIAGQAVGEIRVSSTNGTLKFNGVHAFIYAGVSNFAAAQSTQFSALIAALQKVAVISPDGSNSFDMDSTIAENGTNPVASGVIYDALQAIANTTITTARLEDGAVTERKINDYAVTKNKIRNGAVETSKLADGAVTTDKLDAKAVTEDELDDGAVTSDKLDAGAVTTDKLDTGAVTTEKLASGSVTNAKLAQNSVATANIQNGAVTFGKLGFTPVKYVGMNDIDECVEPGTLYRVHYNGIYELLICGVGDTSCTQYLIKRSGGIQYRTATKSNDEWGSWSEWSKFVTEDKVSTMISGSTPKIMSITVPTSGWSNKEYDITSLMPPTANENTRVDVSASASVQEQLVADGCGGIYASTDTSNNVTTFTLHAMYNKPTANITIQLMLQQTS